jgi:hypothetical protein
MQPESLTSFYSCQAAFPGTRTRCGQPAVSILRAEGATATSATMRAYCAAHDALALTAARRTLGWTHAVLDLVDKPCTACNPDQGRRGREYHAHSCPCHHWDRKPLVDGFCSDPTCSCSVGVYPLGVR